MADVNISKYRASVVRSGSAPATPGFVVSEGQNPVEPAGSEQNHLPVTINATATGLAITTDQVLSGAGTVGQYIRGDGSLADFPASTGGGSSVSYYLNGSISQGTIGGVAYKELSKTPILGAGTQFTINADGYIASFLTDAGDPNLLEIPGGNWNFETYFSASSGGGSPTFYVELYKYDGSTFTLIASNSGSPELIAFGTNVNSYFSTLAVPTTALTLTDRLAIRYYVTHSGRTITLHTENNTLCQIITTFTTGLTALNGLTAQVQYFAVGTSGTDFNIASATQTHTFNLPTASASNRGALSSSDWTTFNNKQNALTNPVTGTGTTNYLPKFTGTSSIGNSIVQDAGIRVDIGGDIRLTPSSAVNIQAYTGSVYTNLFYNAASHNWQNSGGATKMFLNSNDNLLIGTTTDGGQRLQVTGTVALRASASGSSATQIPIFAADPSGTTRELVTRTPAQLLSDIGGQAALTNPVTGTGTTNYLPKFTGSTTIGNSNLINDASGNLGLGVTPSAGGLSGYALFQIAAHGTSIYSGTNQTLIGTNVLWSGGSASYSASTFATLYNQQSGQHQWFNAPSGTAGNAISFTQAMTLNASGNLLVGTTSDNGARLQISGAIYASDELYLDNGKYLRFRRSSGNLSIQTLGIPSGTDDVRLLTTGDFNVLNGSLTNLMTVKNGGNVGIGTSSPSYPLQVRRAGGAGSLGISIDSVGTTDRVAQYFAIQDNASGAGTGHAFYYRVPSSTTDVLGLFLNESGNVGIGTSSPSQKLQIDGGTSSTYILIVGQSRNLYIGQDSIGAAIYSDGNAPMYFATNATERMRITSSGNVGIGTSSPALKLEVAGSGSLAYFRNPSSTAATTYITVINANNTSNGLVMAHLSNGTGYFGTQNSADLSLVTGDSPKMTITSGGNVLIGTTTDAASNQPLQVVKAGSSNYLRVQTDNNASYDAGGLFTDGTNNVYYGMLRGTTGLTGAFSIFTGGNTRFNVTSGGNVLIGTTTDGGNGILQVNKSTSNAVARFTNPRNTSGDFALVTDLGSNCNNTSSYHYIAGTGGADKFYIYGNGTYATVSDRRLKKNIESVTEQFLEKVLALDIVTYNWNDQKDGSDLELGMIAQQVETAFPSIVKTNRPDLSGQTYKSIQASALPYILIKAIQELKQEIDTLKN